MIDGKSELLSPRLAALRDEFAQHPDAARSERLASFWEEVATEGTPLIERAPDRDEHALVTWLVRETDRPIARVTLIDPFSWKTPPERQLQKLPDTDIWFLSWWVRLDLRGTYGFQVQYQDADAPEQLDDPLSQHLEVADWDQLLHARLIMPNAAPLPYLTPRPDSPRGTLHAETFRSEILGNERPIWIHTPANFTTEGDTYPFVVIFDGEAGHSAPLILDDLIAEGAIPPMVAILVNQIGIREHELPGNPDFSRALATELVPSLRERYHLTIDPAKAALNGRSYGGFCSGYTALHHPDVFGNAIMQSPSAWVHPTVNRAYVDPTGTMQQRAVGDDEKIPTLIEEFRRSDPQPIRLYHEVGCVENGPPPARIWQTFANRWLHDILTFKGYDTIYREYVGGHDDAWWRGTFADGIRWVFGDSR